MKYEAMQFMTAVCSVEWHCEQEPCT